MWNDLPKFVRSAVTLIEFTKQLKTFAISTCLDINTLILIILYFEILPICALFIDLNCILILYIFYVLVVLNISDTFLLVA